MVIFPREIVDSDDDAAMIVYVYGNIYYFL